MESYSEILKALETFESDSTKKVSARCEARGLMKNLEKFETAFLTVFWSYLLQHFSRSSKALQGNDTDIALAISQYDSLTDLTSEMRTEADKFFEKFEAVAGNLLPGTTYQEKRQRKRTLRPGETRCDDDAATDGRTMFKRKVFLPILDSLSPLDRAKKTCTRLSDYL